MWLKKNLAKSVPIWFEMQISVSEKKIQKQTNRQKTSEEVFCKSFQAACQSALQRHCTSELINISRWYLQLAAGIKATDLCLAYAPLIKFNLQQLGLKPKTTKSN